MVSAVLLTLLLAGADPMPDLLTVPAEIYRQNDVGIFYNTPPPWPAGNCFTIKAVTKKDGEKILRPLNMHAENFDAIVRKLGLKTVTIQRVGEGACLIVDPRIPNEWLLDKPCDLCTSKALAAELAKSHAEKFRKKDSK